jgi:hypothetical protein
VPAHLQPIAETVISTTMKSEIAVRMMFMARRVAFATAGLHYSCQSVPTDSLHPQVRMSR